MWLIKYRKPALTAMLLLALIAAWRYDRARQYTRGQTDKAAEISLALARRRRSRPSRRGRPARTIRPRRPNAKQKKGYAMCKCRKSSNALFTAAIALTLTACANSTTPSAAKPPADLTQPCAKLQHLAGTTGADILPWAVQTVHLYKDCAARHDALVSVFK